MSSPVAVAVLVPCLNEQTTVGTVVTDFAAALPDATIYVYDNGSTDDTAAVARSAGAVVRHEPRRGKGQVVRRMFADIDADVYIMVDGDATYEAAAAPRMVQRLIAEQLDMVVGVRRTVQGEAFRSGHEWGNRALTGMLARMFGQGFEDILSGYRVLSRRFVKTFPAQAQGFETETELSIHALELRLPTGEVDTDYGARPEGSDSKLSTWSDGWRIATTMVRLYEAERPRQFFGLLAAALAVVALVLAAPLLVTYLDTGLVPRFPTAILSASLMLLAALSLVCGTILQTVTLGRREAKRLAYLRLPAPGPRPTPGPPGVARDLVVGDGSESR